MIVSDLPVEPTCLRKACPVPLVTVEANPNFLPTSSTLQAFATTEPEKPAASTHDLVLSPLDQGFVEGVPGVSTQIKLRVTLRFPFTGHESGG